MMKSIIKNEWNPAHVYQYLDYYVQGQDDLKRSLSVIASLHIYKSVITATRIDLQIPKHTMLICGPSGSGKTYIVKRLAEYSNLPLIHISCATLSTTGFIGSDIKTQMMTLISSLYDQGYCQHQIEHAILFLDEFDKLSFLS